MRLFDAIGKWNKQSRQRQWLWIRAAVLLTLISAALKCLSFARFKKWYIKASDQFANEIVSDSKVSDIIWAVESAARILPFRLLCFPKSLAAKYLLGRTEGVVMHIGVNKDSNNGLEFHAWVEKKGKTILGELPTRFQPLWVWG